MEQRKNAEFPGGIEPQTFGFRAPMLYHWATETMVSEVYYEVLMKQVLYTWEMVNFELVKDIKKEVFHLIASVGQRKILRPNQDSIPHRDS